VNRNVRLGRLSAVILILVLALSGCRQAELAGETGALPVTGAQGLTARPAPVQHPRALLAQPEVSPVAAIHASTSTPAATQVRPFKICSPLAEQTLADLPLITSDPYHPPPAGDEARHHGVDFAYYNRDGRASILGESVQAVMTGQVAAAVTDRFPYGNVVIIETRAGQLPADIAGRINISSDQSLYVLFAHLQNSPLVKLNESVDACQPIGAAGSSGNAGGAHLHLEMRIGPPGERFPSLAYYKMDATPEERQAYLRWRIGGEFNHFDPMLVLK
jgi:murein DD-endopeptidase MepM/ murein hydrolase activator NlpD